MAIDIWFCLSHAGAAAIAGLEVFDGGKIVAALQADDVVFVDNDFIDRIDNVFESYASDLMALCTTHRLNH